jgi:hypothetical protein
MVPSAIVAAMASGESTVEDHALLRCRRIGCRTQAAAVAAPPADGALEDGA